MDKRILTGFSIVHVYLQQMTVCQQKLRKDRSTARCSGAANPVPSRDRGGAPANLSGPVQASLQWAAWLRPPHGEMCSGRRVSLHRGL